MMRWLAAFTALAALALPASAAACTSSASYRSVVLNQPPKTIPEDATLYRVRIEDTYVVTLTRETSSGEKQYSELHGMRGRVLSDGEANEANGIDTSRPFEIKARLGAMCDTWTEQWTDDHDVRDGKLYGYIVGRRAGMLGDRLIIWPMLYRSAKARQQYEEWRPGEVTHGSWLGTKRGRDPFEDKRRYRARRAGEWKPIRFNAKAMAQTLPNTNRLIRKGIQKLDREAHAAEEDTP